jgi:hypothetical protein
MGIPVYHADREAKRLMQEDPDLKAAAERKLARLEAIRAAA